MVVAVNVGVAVCTVVVVPSANKDDSKVESEVRNVTVTEACAGVWVLVAIMVENNLKTTTFVVHDHISMKGPILSNSARFTRNAVASCSNPRPKYRRVDVQARSLCTARASNGLKATYGLHNTIRFQSRVCFLSKMALVNYSKFDWLVAVLSLVFACIQKPVQCSGNCKGRVVE